VWRLRKQAGTGKSLFKSGYQRRFVRLTTTEVCMVAGWLACWLTCWLDCGMLAGWMDGWQAD